MTRQHTTPLLFDQNLATSERLTPLQLEAGADDRVLEWVLRDLIFRHPSCLPIQEIDPLFASPIAICCELSTPAGFIDVFLLTRSGLPVIVETKLWRNPEGRREVVGQIVDYAKELARWSSSDLQREVNKRLGGEARPLFQLVGDGLDEADFNDALTANLRRGRYLLLIAGDGIRQGVETIAEYLQGQPGMHFTLGLVEMPIFRCEDGRYLIAPRLLARTHLVRREVVAVPDNFTVVEPSDDGAAAADPDTVALGDERQRFWAEFLSGLTLDDPDQPIPKPARMGYLSFMLPAPHGSSWLTVYRDLHARKVGIFLSASRNRPGERAMYAIAEDWDSVRAELGGDARLGTNKDGRPSIGDWIATGPLEEPEARAAAFEWLRRRTNDFVNVMRPRVRAVVSDMEPESA